MPTLSTKASAKELAELPLPWTLARTAIDLLAFSTSLCAQATGQRHTLALALHGPASPIRDALIDRLGRQQTLHHLPAALRSEDLLGGLDLTASLATGRRHESAGLWQATRNHTLVIAGADRLASTTTAVLALLMESAKDHRTVMLLDESDAEDSNIMQSALGERIALHVHLPETRLADWPVRQAALQAVSLHAVADAPNAIALTDDQRRQLTLTATALGIDSIRSVIQACQIARLHAAMNGRSSVADADITIAIQLVLAPRARHMPAEQPEEAEEATDNEPADESVDEEVDQTDDAFDSTPSSEETPIEPPDDVEQDAEPDALPEHILEAIAASLPANVLASLAKGQHAKARHSGRDNDSQSLHQRGRPAGVRRPRGMPSPGNLHLLETLKAAVPLQRMRQTGRRTEKNKAKKAQPDIQVRPADFRVQHRKQPTRTTTLFVVDASGSAALHRLAEAKGAVELLLAECYVRRDRVALATFRNTEATLDLPPTRSLVRAKRVLGNLPGGGGTPLAAGFQLACNTLAQLKQAGEQPVAVFMTDGKANIALDGTQSRVDAKADAIASAKQLAGLGVRLLFVDVSPRPSAISQELAEHMQAQYLFLPRHAGMSSLPAQLAAS